MSDPPSTSPSAATLRSTRPSRLRRILPWAISGAALVYVFGYAIDWGEMVEAMRTANVPLFVAITALDKLVFFSMWGVLQAELLRRFIEPVPLREVMAIKGATELLRIVNNSVADAGFMIGASRMVKQGTAALVAVGGVPFACHFGVLLVQATLALPFLPGSPADHLDVSVTVAIGWVVASICWFAVRAGHLRRLLASIGLGTWVDRIRPRELLPFVGWFALFAAFDVGIQGLASRAFGNEIPWVSLVARVPVMYFAISIPSFGNFGTRELAWSWLFEAHAPPEKLIAFAFATNSIFLVMHFLIGVLFLRRAIELLRAVRTANREGEGLPSPILRDSSDR